MDSPSVRTICLEHLKVKHRWQFLKGNAVIGHNFSIHLKEKNITNDNLLNTINPRKEIL